MMIFWLTGLSLALLAGCSAPALETSAQAAQDEFSKSLTMPDPGRRIDHASARSAARQVDLLSPGIRAQRKASRTAQ